MCQQYVCLSLPPLETQIIINMHAQKVGIINPLTVHLDYLLPLLIGNM